MILSEITALIQNGIAGRGNAGDRIAPEDISQAIRGALHALEQDRPYFLDNSVQLIAGQPLYTTPPLFVDFAYSQWGKGKKSYYQGCGVRPHIKTNNRQLHFSPAPTIEQISVWDSLFIYTYKARHTLNEVANECTLQDEDESLLILRAMAELMRLLTTRNVVSPITLSRGLGNVPSNSTPSSIHKYLMAEYKAQVQRWKWV